MTLPRAFATSSHLYSQRPCGGRREHGRDGARDGVEPAVEFDLQLTAAFSRPAAWSSHDA